MGTIFDDSKRFCNVARLQIHTALMYRNAFVARGLHRHVDMDTTTRPCRFGAMPIVMEPEINNAGMLSRDSDGLRYHILGDRSAVIPGKQQPVHISDDRAASLLAFDLVKDFKHALG